MSQSASKPLFIKMHDAGKLAALNFPEAHVKEPSEARRPALADENLERKFMG